MPFDDPAMRLLYYTGEYEPEMQTFAQAVLRPGDRVLDVGANLGVHALMFAGLVGPTGHVTAFEPGPAAVQALERNVALNGWQDRVTIEACALSDRAGQLVIRVSAGVGTVTSSLDLPWLADAPQVEVPARTLDDFQLGSIRLLKLDVEGAEPSVLHGAERTLEDQPPDWVTCEFSSFAPTDAWDLLIDAGYEPVHPGAGFTHRSGRPRLEGEMVVETVPFRYRTAGGIR